MTLEMMLTLEQASASYNDPETFWENHYKVPTEVFGMDSTYTLVPQTFLKENNITSQLGYIEDRKIFIPKTMPAVMQPIAAYMLKFNNLPEEQVWEKLGKGYDLTPEDIDTDIDYARMMIAASVIDELVCKKYPMLRLNDFRLFVDTVKSEFKTISKDELDGAFDEIISKYQSNITGKELDLRDDESLKFYAMARADRLDSHGKNKWVKRSRASIGLKEEYGLDLFPPVRADLAMIPVLRDEELSKYIPGMFDLMNQLRKGKKGDSYMLGPLESRLLYLCEEACAQRAAPFEFTQENYDRTNEITLTGHGPSFFQSMYIRMGQALQNEIDKMDNALKSYKKLVVKVGEGDQEVLGKARDMLIGYTKTDKTNRLPIPSIATGMSVVQDDIIANINQLKLLQTEADQQYLDTRTAIQAKKSLEQLGIEVPIEVERTISGIQNLLSH